MRWRGWIDPTDELTRAFLLSTTQLRKGEQPGEETEYTLLIYLNGRGEQDLIGGDTVFWATKKKELCRIQPECGQLLLHAHGRRCLLHAGDQVIKGCKYMIRADVMYAPQ